MCSNLPFPSEVLLPFFPENKNKFKNKTKKHMLSSVMYSLTYLQTQCYIYKHTMSSPQNVLSLLEKGHLFERTLPLVKCDQCGPLCIFFHFLFCLQWHVWCLGMQLSSTHLSAICTEAMIIYTTPEFTKRGDESKHR